MDCVFCNIIEGTIPSKKIYEDNKVLAFYDINPLAPVHFLVIPKEHISSADEIDMSNSEVIGYIFSLIPKICKKLRVTNGYRILTNIGDDAGQTVEHLHFQVLGGSKLAPLA